MILEPHEQLVSKTVRSPIFESQVIRSTGGPMGEHFYAQVVFKGKVVRKSKPIFDQDEAEAKADMLREEVFRENYGKPKRQ